MLVAAWALILGLTGWCIWRVLRGDRRTDAVPSPTHARMCVTRRRIRRVRRGGIGVGDVRALGATLGDGSAGPSDPFRLSRASATSRDGVGIWFARRIVDDYF